MADPKPQTPNPKPQTPNNYSKYFFIEEVLNKNNKKG